MHLKVLNWRTIVAAGERSPDRHVSIPLVIQKAPLLTSNDSVLYAPSDENKKLLFSE